MSVILSSCSGPYFISPFCRLLTFKSLTRPASIEPESLSIFVRNEVSARWMTFDTDNDENSPLRTAPGVENVRLSIEYKLQKYQLVPIDSNS